MESKPDRYLQKTGCSLESSPAPCKSNTLYSGVGSPLSCHLYKLNPSLPSSYLVNRCEGLSQDRPSKAMCMLSLDSHWPQLLPSRGGRLCEAEFTGGVHQGRGAAGLENAQSYVIGPDWQCFHTFLSRVVTQLPDSAYCQRPSTAAT